MDKDIEREIITLTEEDNSDFTGRGPWTINCEDYIFVEDYPSQDCDGECHNVIMVRESDEKYFRFTWQYYHDNYYFDDELYEVFPKTTLKTIYE